MPISSDDNDLITRVEGQAPMGQFLRKNYWFPTELSSKLEPDGPPTRTQLLGQWFVVFRATDGRVGFFNEGCPHRGVSLALARNEDNALRCIFHGWKFSVSGDVVEVPTEPVNTEAFCKSVPLKHYPVREAAGIVWVWLGGGEPAPFPEFEFMNLPPGQVYPIRQHLNYNWVQSLEGNVDAAHVGVLHQAWLGPISNGGTLAAANMQLAPHYELEDTKAGFRYAAIRNLTDGRKYIRLTEYAAPWYTFISSEEGGAQSDRSCVMSVPLDNETFAYWTVRYNPFKVLGRSPYNPVEDPSDWPPGLNAGPNERWGQDRVAMRNGSFSGYHFVTTEDFAVMLSQGHIANRSEEFLNSGDKGIVCLRKILIDAVKEWKAGTTPAVARHSEIPYASIRVTGDIVPAAFDWRVWKEIEPTA